LSNNRYYIPGCGADRESIQAGMNWLLSAPKNQELFLFLSIKDHLREGKVIHSIYGDNFCKPLKNNNQVIFQGRLIKLTTEKMIPYSLRNARILVIHSSEKTLLKLEKNDYDVDIMVVSWTCFHDLPKWIKKTNANQYMEYLPIDPKNLPGWMNDEKYIENIFIFDSEKRLN
jgi:hypothetical protein